MFRSAFVTILTLSLSAAPAFAAQEAEDAPSGLYPREVSLIRALEKRPLTTGSADRTELFQWLADEPDLRLSWCAGLLLEAKDADGEIGGAALIQAILSAGAAVIDYPEIEKDYLATARAGIAGALRAYEATLRAEPKRRSSFLDGLLARQAAGTLDEYIRPKLADCEQNEPSAL
jgi:hypothetical protein